MSTLFSQLMSMNFTTFIWIFFLVFVIHEFEEWNIDRFEHRNFVDFLPEATDRSARLWIGCIVLLGLLWCIMATLWGNSTTAWLILPAISIMIQNALQHLFWMFYFHKYAPGVVTAVCLMIPLGCYIITFATLQGLIPLWYVMICVSFIIIGFIQTIRAGNKVSPLIRGINKIGIWLSNRI
jgi:hypothetical protein